MSIAFRSQMKKDCPETLLAGWAHRTASVTEAPDRGETEREAPEARLERQAEAPDAGEGRANKLEHEFTHGRSQS